MSAEHTPGPWVAILESDVWVSGADGRSFICDIVARDEGRAKIQPANDMDFANARLIAAAPDLLQAIRAFLAEWDAQMPEDDISRMLSQITGEREPKSIAGLRSAKAKAEATR